jgi:hypothetical protein
VSGGAQLTTARDEKQVSLAPRLNRHEIDVRSDKTAEGLLHALEWTRTTTGKTPHKALNPVRPGNSTGHGRRYRCRYATTASEAPARMEAGCSALPTGLLFSMGASGWIAHAMVGRRSRPTFPCASCSFLPD